MISKKSLSIVVLVVLFVGNTLKAGFEFNETQRTAVRVLGILGTIYFGTDLKKEIFTDGFKKQDGKTSLGDDFYQGAKAVGAVLSIVSMADLSVKNLVNAATTSSLGALVFVALNRAKPDRDLGVWPMFFAISGFAVGKELLKYYKVPVFDLSHTQQEEIKKRLEMENKLLRERLKELVGPTKPYIPMAQG